jgi:hypothetical protein
MLVTKCFIGSDGGWGRDITSRPKHYLKTLWGDLQDMGPRPSFLPLPSRGGVGPRLSFLYLAAKGVGPRQCFLPCLRGWQTNKTESPQPFRLPIFNKLFQKSDWQQQPYPDWCYYASTYSTILSYQQVVLQRLFSKRIVLQTSCSLNDLWY